MFSVAHVTGILHSEPKEYLTADGELSVYFLLNVIHKGKNNKKISNLIPCKAYEKVAEYCRDILEVGCLYTAVGSLRTKNNRMSLKVNYINKSYNKITGYSDGAIEISIDEAIDLTEKELIMEDNNG